MNSTSLELIERLNSSRPKGADYFFMPFSSVHVRQISLTQDDVLAASKYVNIERAASGQAILGHSVTAFLRGEPVVCFGVIPIWNGVAEAWFLADDKARGEPLALTRMTKRFLDIAEISLGLRRLQITVRTTHMAAIAWAKALKFNNEGLMLGYGPDGVDYLLMARYR